MPQLIELLTKDERPMIRGTAAWAIGKIAAAEAEEVLLAALQLEQDPDVLNEIRTLVTKLNINTDLYLPLIEETILKVNENIEFIEQIGVSVSSYRSMINLSDLVLYSKFYTQTKIAACKLDDMINTIIYPEHLTADDISELNDDFVENVIKAEIPLDDLLKISIYFSFDHQESRDVA